MLIACFNTEKANTYNYSRIVDNGFNSFLLDFPCIHFGALLTLRLSPYGQGMNEATLWPPDKVETCSQSSHWTKHVELFLR